jgi:FemAB-related protein (PEP-CTERM system-associated)
MWTGGGFRQRFAGMPNPLYLQLHSMPSTSRAYLSEDCAAWDNFVRNHPHGTPFHLTAWMRFLISTYGYKPVYLLSEQEGQITGVLPLFLIRNFLIGKALISVPFAVYGGILADSDEARQVLAEAVANLGREHGVQHVELRNGHESQQVGFSKLDRYVSFRQGLEKTEDEILTEIPRKTRRMVRKALKCDYETHTTRELATFFDLYSANLRRLGTPCFPRSHFDNLLEQFGDMIDLREMHLEGKTVAAVLTFLFNGEVHPYYGASDPAFNASAPNNYMYFDLMRWGAANSYRRFDFGRSKKGAGSRDFKAHWGMEEVELPYEMLLVKGKSLPNMSPNNPKFKIFIKLWQKIPLSVTRVLGPMVIRLLP